MSCVKRCALNNDEEPAMGIELRNRNDSIPHARLRVPRFVGDWLIEMIRYAAVDNNDMSALGSRPISDHKRVVVFNFVLEF